jgi:hypothetical protein
MTLKCASSGSGAGEGTTHQNAERFFVTLSRTNTCIRPGCGFAAWRFSVAQTDEGPQLTQQAAAPIIALRSAAETAIDVQRGRSDHAQLEAHLTPGLNPPQRFGIWLIGRESRGVGTRGGRFCGRPRQ